MKLFPQTGDLRGTLNVCEESGELHISGEITGFEGEEKSVHGFHVHEKPDLGKDCKDTKGHFNPTNVRK